MGRPSRGRQGLPGQSLSDVLDDFEHSTTPRRVLIVGGDEASGLADRFARAELLRDVDHLAAVIPSLDV